MTLREWISGCEKGIHFRTVFDMADRLGIDMKESRDCYSDNEIEFFDTQLDFKCTVVISMFARKFGLDEEI